MRVLVNGADDLGLLKTLAKERRDIIVSLRPHHITLAILGLSQLTVQHRCFSASRRSNPTGIQ